MDFFTGAPRVSVNEATKDLGAEWARSLRRVHKDAQWYELSTGSPQASQVDLAGLSVVLVTISPIVSLASPST